MDRPPLIVAPYDAELFGHWWFEGPQFLEFLIRKAALRPARDRAGHAVRRTSTRHPLVQQVEPSLSSWGAEGYAKVWLNGGNDWIYRHQHVAERRMLRLAQRFPNADGALERATLEPGGPRAAAGAELRLGLHHAQRDLGALRASSACVST